MSDEMTDDLLSRLDKYGDAKFEMWWSEAKHAATRIRAQAAQLATADRCLRHCYEKLQPFESFDDWLQQWEKP